MGNTYEQHWTAVGLYHGGLAGRPLFFMWLGKQIKLHSHLCLAKPDFRNV